MKVGVFAGIGLCVWLSACLWRAPLLAQAPQTPATPPPSKSVLANTGAPIHIPFQCTNDDMEWAGMTCTDEEPCPVYLELAAVESVGNRIFLAGNIHYSASTLYSVLVTSDDAGKTWAEPYDRMRGVVLDHVQFIDFENGWVGGQVLVPVAQDPFLLITSDSGKTWRKRPIFGENRAGTLADFWFGSPTNGFLLIDRSKSGEDGKYELYESMTGGESWMLREVNEKPIPMRHARTPNTDWHIRADGPSKSFRIERRQGEKWVSFASFLVPIANCKPVEPPETQQVTPQPLAQAPSEQPPAPAARQPPSLKRPPK